MSMRQRDFNTRALQRGQRNVEQSRRFFQTISRAANMREAAEERRELARESLIPERQAMFDRGIGASIDQRREINAINNAYDRQQREAQDLTMQAISRPQMLPERQLGSLTRASGAMSGRDVFNRPIARLPQRTTFSDFERPRTLPQRTEAYLGEGRRSSYRSNARGDGVPVGGNVPILGKNTIVRPLSTGGLVIAPARSITSAPSAANIPRGGMPPSVRGQAGREAYTSRAGTKALERGITRDALELKRRQLKAELGRDVSKDMARKALKAELDMQKAISELKKQGIETSLLENAFQSITGGTAQAGATGQTPQLKEFSVGGFKFDIPQTEEQRQAELQQLEERERTKAGVKQEAKQQESVISIENIRNDLNDILTEFRNIPEDLKGPVEGRTFGQAAKFAKTSPELTGYEDFKQFILSNISRQLGGERGVLTDRDIARIEGALPNIADTEETAQRKMDLLQNFIERRIANKTGTQPQTTTAEGVPIEGQSLNAFATPEQVSAGREEVPIPNAQNVPITSAADPVQDDDINNHLNRLGL